MSGVLGAGTLVNGSTSYYGSGGGGGSSISSFSVASISSLTVSSINGAAPGSGGSTITVSSITADLLESVFLQNVSTMETGYLTVADTANVTNNLFFGSPSDNTLIYGNSGVLTLASDANSTIQLAVGGGVTYVNASGISTGTLQATLLNDMAIKTGKAPYLVGGGNFYVPAAGTTVPLAQFSTNINHLYQLEMPYVRIQNEPATAPAAGAWAEFVVDTTVPTSLDTFDMERVSTINNDLLKAPVYSFVASATGHVLSAQGSLANTVSTAVTLGGNFCYLKDLGAVTNMPPIG